jgi:UDP-N-acetylmuramoyl-tripeptide--D-alanyl-D-alanine ligase
VEWTVDQVASAVEGSVPHEQHRERLVTGVSIDSRSIDEGDLFVAVRAERDGHDFVPAAVRGGATAALVDEAGADAMRGGEPLIVVPGDTVAALGRLGRAARRRMASAVVVGITGSVGKTTTKDLLAAALGSSKRTVASERSLNNEMGVPLTLLRGDDDTQAVVVEMGARGTGHIAALCAIAEPSVGVVTSVGAAHLGMFGDLDGVAAAKGELVEALPSTGTAVLNAADGRVLAMRTRTTAAVVTFGPTGDVRAERVRLDDQLHATFDLLTPWGRAEVASGARGRHNVANALAAAGAALATGVPLEAVAEGLSTPLASPWRMEVRRAPAGGIVLNDAYNANPTSMRAAVESLTELPASRRVAVLGVMAELGEEAPAAHREIAALVQEAGIELLPVGTDWYGAEPLDVEQVLERLAAVPVGTAVLVKGSRVSGLERVAEALAG